MPCHAAGADLLPTEHECCYAAMEGRRPLRRACSLVPFPINACLVRADAVKAAGRFDEGLITCEDWDLWQRMARRGARFGLVEEILAVYRMRASSTMANTRALSPRRHPDGMLGHRAIHESRTRTRAR